MYLTSVNSELWFGFYLKVKKYPERWNQNQGNKYSLDMMMDQNPSNIIMQKSAKYLPLENFVS